MSLLMVLVSLVAERSYASLRKQYVSIYYLLFGYF
jgi:hypothetical protein